MTRQTRILGWSLAVVLLLAAFWVPDVRAWLFLLGFWAIYRLVFGSPFIIACLLIWYLVRRVDRGTRQRGFDVVPPGRESSSRAGGGGTP